MIEVRETLEPHRPALTGHCYRMLGSTVEADDAVQETMLRAWKAWASFDEQSSVGTWLHRIATNVCLDELRSRKRRELPTQQGSAGTVDDELTRKPRSHWLEPVPDALALPPEATPEQRMELRQSLRLAFVAVLQKLPPRQRAVLLLKDVLGFATEDIAQTLQTTAPSVNSALQRARKRLAETPEVTETSGPPTLSATQREVVERYVDAFHSYDVDALVALVREDGTLCMPPYTLWLQGRPSIHDWMLGRGLGCRGSRLVPTHACGRPAFGQYRRSEDGGFRPWSLIVLELGPTCIRSIIHFLDVDTLFPIFGLPSALSAAEAVEQ